MLGGRSFSTLPFVLPTLLCYGRYWSPLVRYVVRLLLLFFVDRSPTIPNVTLFDYVLRFRDLLLLRSYTLLFIRLLIYARWSCLFCVTVVVRVTLFAVTHVADFVTLRSTITLRFCCCPRCVTCTRYVTFPVTVFRRSYHTLNSCVHTPPLHVTHRAFVRFVTHYILLLHIYARLPTFTFVRFYVYVLYCRSPVTDFSIRLLPTSVCSDYGRDFAVLLCDRSVRSLHVRAAFFRSFPFRSLRACDGGYLLMPFLCTLSLPARYLRDSHHTPHRHYTHFCTTCYVPPVVPILRRFLSAGVLVTAFILLRC